jgi:hypothetical protein
MGYRGDIAYLERSVQERCEDTDAARVPEEREHIGHM